MKNYVKNYLTTLLLAGMCLFSCEVFSASEATKRMIHDTLSKFCIPPKKENCNPREEGQYDPNYNFCLCENDGMVYNKSERKCIDCEAGTYYRRNMKDNSCKSCSPGTYQDKEGQSSCKDCEAGKYQDETGKGECKNCPSGTFQDAKGQKGCKKCPKGHFSVLKDKYCYFSFIHFGLVCKPKEASLIKVNTSCTKCSAGTYQDKEGQSSCKDCPDGKFQPDSGKSKCETCDANACYKVTNNRTKCEYDCTTPNLTACSGGTCVQCTSDSYCSGSTPYCSGTRCVECTSDSHCGSNYRCSRNSCVCNVTDSDCECGMKNSGCGCARCPDPEPDTGNDECEACVRCWQQCYYDGKHVDDCNCPDRCTEIDSCEDW